jgi:hypothetical protein
MRARLPVLVPILTLVAGMLPAGGVRSAAGAAALDGAWSGNADGETRAAQACSPIHYVVRVAGHHIGGVGFRVDRSADTAMTTVFPIAGVIRRDGSVGLVIQRFAEAEARVEDGHIVGLQQNADCRYEFTWTHD